ncbi:hypothetical protein GCM10010198_08660 [Nocardia seriolae]
MVVGQSLPAPAVARQPVQCQDDRTGRGTETMNMKLRHPAHSAACARREQPARRDPNFPCTVTGGTDNSWQTKPVGAVC